MSIESFSPLPLNTFGSWITLLDPSDVPPGLSPNLADVEFFPGGVRTRPGLASQFPVLGGAPQINGLKTYITTNLVQRLLALDSLGNLYKETSPGVLSLAASIIEPDTFLASTTSGTGTNENTNLLLRQYSPRATDLSDYSQAQLDQVARRLNEHARKTLSSQTPASRLHASVAHRPSELATKSGDFTCYLSRTCRLTTRTWKKIWLDGPRIEESMSSSNVANAYYVVERSWALRRMREFRLSGASSMLCP
jgi:hypothetical protein